MTHSYLNRSMQNSFKKPRARTSLSLSPQKIIHRHLHTSTPSIQIAPAKKNNATVSLSPSLSLPFPIHTPTQTPTSISYTHASLTTNQPANQPINPTHEKKRNVTESLPACLYGTIHPTFTFRHSILPAEALIPFRQKAEEAEEEEYQARGEWVLFGRERNVDIAYSFTEFRVGLVWDTL